MNKKIRVIEIDGCDAVGKTTQINELKKIILSKDYELYTTRLLGGDGECEYQMGYRKLLLHSKFPKDSVELEEMMFAETDLKGIEDMRTKLNESEKTFVIKDRSLASHVVYALSKGMNNNQIDHVHREVIRQNRLINQEFGSVHIILVPKRLEMVIERLNSRNQKDGTEIVERLENLETQRRVVEGMKTFSNMNYAEGLNVELIEVGDSDSILDLHAKIAGVLNSKYEF